VRHPSPPPLAADLPYLPKGPRRQLRRNPSNEIALVDMETPPSAEPDLKAVRIGISAELRTLHADLLREEVPDRIAALLKQLDQQKDTDSA
jgi:hypothetical protein